MLMHAIADFGHRMGMPAFALSDTGCAVLRVDGVGTLTLESVERGGMTELLISLANPVLPHEKDRIRRALERCHYSNADPMPLQAGSYADQLLFLTRMPENEVTAASIEKAILFLISVQRTCGV